MLRVRTSTLEQFRRCVQTDFADPAALERAIRGEPDEPNRNMEVGTLWHRLLAGQGWWPSRDQPATFNPADIDAGRRHLGPGLQEVTGFRRFGDVLVEGTCDHIRGLVVKDVKTKVASAADCRDYENSLQWRLYLLIHGGQVFQYELFEFYEKKGHCSAKNVVTCRFFAYPGMEQDCQRWIRRFADWATSKGLAGFLEKDRRGA